MKAFAIEGQDGEYKATQVDVFDKDEEIDWEKVDHIGQVVFLEDDQDIIYVLEYNGMDALYTPSMEDIEEEFEDEVVAALKADGIFREIEYSDDPDEDDELTEIKLITLHV